MKILFPLLILFSSFCFAEEDNFDLMSVEDLLNFKISVASKSETTLRQAAGIVSVITQDDIKLSGARDLIDILDKVPGFQFGSDNEGVVGLGFRGLWGHEGKILLIIDGQELNEQLYGTLPLANQIPIQMIKQIEIIRGPGSAVYGGNAELAVIKITTDTEKYLATPKIILSTGKLNQSLTHQSIDFGSAHSDADWSLRAVGHIDNGQLTEKNTTDSSGQTISLLDYQKQQSQFISIGGHYKDLNGQFLFSQLKSYDITSYGTNLPNSTDINFSSYSGSFNYGYQILPAWKLTPDISVKKDEPWKAVHIDKNIYLNTYYNRSNIRTKYALINDVNLNKDMNLQIGLESYNDVAEDHTDYHFKDGSLKQNYQNKALFVQYLWKNDWADLTLGSRSENHNIYGTSTVPRLSLVRLDGANYYKFLSSQAFHSPTVENINTSQGVIKPEKTQINEFEIGRSFSDNIFASLNFYDISMSDVIVYNYTDGDSYKNFNHSGTRGLELSSKWKDSWGLINFSYSYYEASTNSVTYYQIPNDTKEHLGFATNKMVLNGNFKLFNKNNWLSPSISYLGERYGYDYDASASNGLSIKSFSPTVMADLFWESKKIFATDFDFGLGFYNILNTNYQFIQPYNGGHAPLPGRDREMMVRIGYTKNL